MTSQAERRASLSTPEIRPNRVDVRQRLLAGGSLLGALAASSCCLVPLALFGLGVSGAWIGYLTRLAPYQPYFLAVAAACLALGIWLRHRSNQIACSGTEICARPMADRVVTIGFVFAIMLISAALGLGFLGPLFL